MIFDTSPSILSFLLTDGLVNLSLFVGGFWGLNIAAIIVGLFVLAMMVLIVALMLFMKEVQLAKRTLGVGREFSVDEADPRNPF